MAVTVERLVAEIEANPDGAVAALGTFDAAAAAAAKDRTANIDVDAGAAEADLATLDAAAAAATRDRTINIHVDKDSLDTLTGAIKDVEGALSGLTQGLGALNGAGGGGGGVGGAGGGFSGATKGASGFSGALSAMGPVMTGLQIAAFVGLISALPGAFAAAAGAVGALVAAIVPLVGLIATLTTGIGALVLGFGALAVALIPVIKGITATMQMQKANSQSAVVHAQRVRDLAAAERALSQAYISQQRAAMDLKDAREKLAKAPTEAREHLAQLSRDHAHAILNEKQAVLSLEQAQKNLNDIQNRAARSAFNLTKQTDEFTGKVYEVAQSSGDASDAALQQEQAMLAVQEAQLGVKDAQAATKKSTDDLNEAQKKGIKNSDIMVAALRRVQDAEWAVASSADAVAAAHSRIAEAQKRLKYGADSQQLNAYAQTMAKLSDEGKQFVHFVVEDLMPAFSGLSQIIQTTLLPGVEDGLKLFLGFRKEISLAASAVGTILGNAFRDFFQHWATPQNKQRLANMFLGLLDVLESITELATPLSDILVSLTTDAAPLTKLLTNDLVKGLNKLSKWLQSPKGKKETEGFFERTYKWTHLWLDLLSPILSLIGSIATAAEPLAEDLFGSMIGDLDRVRDKLKTPEGKDNLLQYFNDQKPALIEFGRTIKGVFDLLFDSSKGGKDSAFYKALHEINTKLLPDLKELFEQLDKSDLLPTLVDGLDSVISLMSTLNKSGATDSFIKSIKTVSDVISAVNWTFKKLDDLTGGKFFDVLWKTSGMGLFTTGLTLIKDIFVIIKDTVQWIGDHIGDIWDSVKKIPGNLLNKAIKMIPNPVFRAAGGTVKKGQSYIVGERRAEVFTATQDGRITPSVAQYANTAPMMTSAAQGYSDDQLEDILNKVLDRMRPIQVNTTNEADPLHVANEIAWHL